MRCDSSCVETPPLVDAAVGEPVELRAPRLSELVDGIAADGHGLVMLMGKGGVGKTTLAAAVAVELAHRGLPVHLTTSDPAAHLAETLHGSLDNLTVSRIDPHAETERYRQAGAEDERREARRAGARLARRGFALAVHRGNRGLPGLLAHHPRGGREVRRHGHRPDRPHATPAGCNRRLPPRDRADAGRQGRALHNADDAAAGRAPNQSFARDARGNHARPRSGQPAIGFAPGGIEPWAWVVNNSVAAARPHSPLLQQRAKNELGEVEKVATTHARRYAVVPLLREEPVGVSRLLELAGRTDRFGGKLPIVRFPLVVIASTHATVVARQLGSPRSGGSGSL